ncbi:MAG: hypothetical protein IKB34_01580 [Clostridia bacterium]|nr:hypothetical protein [Clostridia bacterium]
MLRKLIKNEFVATAKTYLILILVCVAFGVFTALSSILFGSLTDNPALMMLVTLPSLFLGSMLFPVAMAFPIFHSAWRFYKSMAADEGYLMHMLPVPTWMLVFSKGIVGTVWVLLSSLFGMASYVLSQATSTIVLAGHDFTVSDALGMIEALENMLKKGLNIDPNIVFVIVNVALITLLSLILSILSIYLCIAIGQLWTAHRILGSVLAYFALNAVTNILVSVMLVLFVIIAVESLTAFNIVLSLCTLLTAACCVACYLVTVHLFKNKLNLQ